MGVRRSALALREKNLTEELFAGEKPVCILLPLTTASPVAYIAYGCRLQQFRQQIAAISARL